MHTSLTGMERELYALLLDPRRLTRLLAYSVSCALLHTLLQQHYFSTCKSSWLALFSVDPSPYCAVVRRGLSALQWSPLLAAGALIPRN